MTKRIEEKNRNQKNKDKEKEEDDKNEKERKDKDDKEKEENKKEKAGKEAGICRHFSRFNNCKYGIGGKGCRYHHPKICTKFRKGGSGPQGCTKGRFCQNFRQKICRSSLQGVPCNRPKGTCNYIHPRFQRDGNRYGRDYRSNNHHFLGGG